MAIASNENALRTAIECKENEGLLDAAAKAMKRIADGVRKFIKGIIEDGKVKGAHNAQAQPFMDDVKALEQMAKLMSEAFDTMSENEEAGQKNNTSGEVRYSKTYTTDGVPLVLIEGNILDGQRKPYEKYVSKYLENHVNEYYSIIESGSKVYFGKDLPGEYTMSESRKGLDRRRKKAKYMASIHLGELIEISTNRKWNKNTKDKHKIDAKFGFYRYDTKFAIPKFDTNKNIVSYYIYDAVILIQNHKNGKKYLYDLINIKQDKSSSLSQSWKTKIDNVSSTYPDVNNIPQVIDDVKFRGRKAKNDLIDADYLAAVERGDMETAQRMVDEAAKAAGTARFRTML